MRSVSFNMNIWLCLSVASAIMCATGSASAQRVVPPPPKEQLSVEEQTALDKLYRSGEAVYSVGSRACVVELERLATERAVSRSRAPAITPDMMQASFETDMYFAQARLDAIVNHCGAYENRGDYEQTEGYLKQLVGSCRLTFSTCEARRHY